MILVGITVYCPDVQRLAENIRAVYPQADGMLLVVNGYEEEENAENSADIRTRIREVLEEERRIAQQGGRQIPFFILENERNEGVAKALNQMFAFAEKNGYDFVLTLDQDSVCAKDLISHYRKYPELMKNSMLSPLLLDRNYEQTASHRGETEEISSCITSGALCPVFIWKKAGGFYEPLFIDYVDYDFSARVREAGYKIYRINRAHLLHELGRGENHRFFGKRITVLNHSPLRKYFTVRNWKFYMKVHKGSIDYGYEKKKFCFYFLKTILYEDQKAEKWKAMRKGSRDAKKLVAGYYSGR